MFFRIQEKSQDDLTFLQNCLFPILGTLCIKLGSFVLKSENLQLGLRGTCFVDKVKCFVEILKTLVPVKCFSDCQCVSA